MVSLFNDEVEAVVGQIPIAGISDGPGNLGNGRRTGARIDATAPLDALGLKGGELRFKAVAQRTSVDDPVTGESRRFSDETDWNYSIDIRQPLPELKLIWGGLYDRADDVELFRLKELRKTDGRGQPRSLCRDVRIHRLRGTVHGVGCAAACRGAGSGASLRQTGHRTPICRASRRARRRAEQPAERDPTQFACRGGSDYRVMIHAERGDIVLRRCGSKTAGEPALLAWKTVICATSGSTCSSDSTKIWIGRREKALAPFLFEAFGRPKGIRRRYGANVITRMWRRP